MLKRINKLHAVAFIASIITSVVFNFIHMNFHISSINESIIIPAIGITMFSAVRYMWIVGLIGVISMLMSLKMSSKELEKYNKFSRLLFSVIIMLMIMTAIGLAILLGAC